MALARNKRERKEKVDIISLQDRAESRSAISSLNELLDAIENTLETGNKLSDSVSYLLRKLTKSSNLDTQFNTIEALLEDTVNTYMDKLKKAAPHSLSCFAEYMNPDEYPAPHQEWMCNQLERLARREILRAMFSLPPGHGKSVYCSHLFPAWYLGNHPDHKYIQAGHTQDFVDEEFGKRVRANINSELYHNVFPKVILDPFSKAAGRFAIANHRGKYLGRGIGGGISGFRANCAAVDDPFASREDAESPQVRKKVFDWFNADLSTRLLPRSPLFIVATRWHTDDLCGRIEKDNNDKLNDINHIPWFIVNLPAICEVNDDFLGRFEGDALWESFYSKAHLFSLRSSLSSRDWNSLYQGHPIDSIGGSFQREWITRYSKLPLNELNEYGNVSKMHVRRVIVSVDTASKTKERNDYTAISVWIEDEHRKHYLAEVIREKVEFNDMVDLIEGTVLKWNRILVGSKVSAILIEDKGSGTQYIQTRSDKAPAPVIAIEVGLSSKEFRFDGVTPMFESGEVLLPESANWLPDYEAELLAFPTGTHDDQVDSTSQYLSWARQRRHGGTKKLGSGPKATEGRNSARPFAGTRKFGLRNKYITQPTPSSKIAG